MLSILYYYIVFIAFLITFVSRTRLFHEGTLLYGLSAGSERKKAQEGLVQKDVSVYM